jgi:hypothetical protein
MILVITHIETAQGLFDQTIRLNPDGQMEVIFN